jgi:hypothetical protein
VPDGYFTTTAKNDVCPNPLFAGLSYPDKLDSYSHGPMGTPLVKDVSGASGLLAAYKKCRYIMLVFDDAPGVASGRLRVCDQLF